MHIEEDLFVPGNSLYIDGNSLKTTDGKSKHSIVGVSVEAGGYYEGTGYAAIFKSITGFYQISANKVLVVDRGNHCIRLVNRSTNTTQAFVGLCTVTSYKDGRDSNARFNNPHSIIPDKLNPGSLLITEYLNQAIRQLTIQSKIVSTFLQYTNDQFHPRGICQQSETGNLFVSSPTYISKIDYHRKAVVVYMAGQSSRGNKYGRFADTYFTDLQEVLLISNDTKLLAADKGYQIKTLDMASSRSSHICKHYGHTDGKHPSCNVKNPYALTVIGNTLYIGENQRIRIIQGNFTFAMAIILQ